MVVIDFPQQVVDCQAGVNAPAEEFAAQRQIDQAVSRGFPLRGSEVGLIEYRHHSELHKPFAENAPDIGIDRHLMAHPVRRHQGQVGAVLLLAYQGGEGAAQRQPIQGGGPPVQGNFTAAQRGIRLQKPVNRIIADVLAGGGKEDVVIEFVAEDRGVD